MRFPLLLVVALLIPLVATAQNSEKPPIPTVRALIERYATDQSDIERFFDIPFSPESLSRAEHLAHDSRATLETLDFKRLSQSDRIDYLLLKSHLTYQEQLAARQRARDHEIRALLPFSSKIVDLEEQRRKIVPIDAEKAAATLNSLTAEIKSVRERVHTPSDTSGSKPLKVSPVAANRAAGRVEELKQTLDGWFRHYDGYNPDFGWWCRKPYEATGNALTGYAKFMREEVAGIAPDGDALLGDPIGREALLEDLQHEMIPYTPEELIRIAEKEYAWCEEQMRLAAREMGKGDDWKAALAMVKSEHAPPGKQDELIASLAREVIAFVDAHDLVTIDPLCRDTWDVQMLSPDEQKYLPFAAYGGQKMLVAYPTDQMDYDARQMSLRANNIHFTRNVVPHELIPGHHLQGYMAERYAAYRGLFNTPFLVEGWALYWEMLLWDMHYARGPEDRIGMLFWRMHRCARIVVSLNFHLGKMTPSQMVDYLVDRVGHERDAATSEVRRFIGGGYSPLYQVAYMIGGLQLRALRRELVDSGKMTNRQFHDAVLRENAVPVEMIRAALTGAPLAADHTPSWRFAGDP